MPALQAALQRLIAEGRDNSLDARAAIAETLAPLGVTGRRRPRRCRVAARPSDAEDLRRLAAPRARITIRGVGTFDLALFTAEAPATVLRFARLAEVGLLQRPHVPPRRAELRDPGRQPGRQRIRRRRATSCATRSGLWPHVRGAVGISTRGRDTGDAQIFIDLVDNPRLDHDYTVFAQVLNGIDVVDRILEGDVIETIEISSVGLTCSDPAPRSAR